MGRTDRASRMIDADPEQVYAAFSDPDALAAWLPPDGMSATFNYFDFRPGGTHQLTLSYDNIDGARGKSTASSDVVTACFIDIVPRERIVQTVEFEAADASYAGTMTMTWEIAKTDGGSLVTFTADNVPLGIDAADHQAGLTSSLANLAAYVGR